jgi:hypothetical protein
VQKESGFFRAALLERIHNGLMGLDKFGEIVGDLSDQGPDAQFKCERVPHAQKNSVLRDSYDFAMEIRGVLGVRVQIARLDGSTHGSELVLEASSVAL